MTRCGWTFPVIAIRLTSSTFLLLASLSLSMEMTASAALRTMLSSSTAAASRGISGAVLERSFLCSDGLQLAAQHYPAQPPIQANSNTTTTTTKKILCLHGWLDNARSFHLLAPFLHNASTNTELVLLDFPGHGLSQHKSPDSPNILAELTFYVAELVQQLQWDNFCLMGHSMGAAVSLMYAAAFPEQVHKLVLLEGAGPLYRKPQDFSKHIRTAIERRQSGNAQLYPQYSISGGNIESTQTSKGPRIYPSLDVAVETRVKTATLSPGQQYLSSEAAQAMVERATISVPDGGVQFRHDPRLSWPSLMYSTQTQVEAMQHDVQCPTCLLLAKDGWPFDQDRLDRTLQLLQPAVFDTLDGSHHFHADPDHADEVARRVQQFLDDKHS